MHPIRIEVGAVRLGLVARPGLARDGEGDDAAPLGAEVAGFHAADRVEPGAEVGGQRLDAGVDRLQADAHRIVDRGGEPEARREVGLPVLEAARVRSPGESASCRPGRRVRVDHRRLDPLQEIAADE